MTGLEPATLDLASQYSSHLSYIRIIRGRCSANWTIPLYITFGVTGVGPAASASQAQRLTPRLHSVQSSSRESNPSITLTMRTFYHWATRAKMVWNIRTRTWVTHPWDSFSRVGDSNPTRDASRALSIKLYSKPHSGRQDLNLQLLGSKPSTLPIELHPVTFPT